MKKIIRTGEKACAALLAAVLIALLQGNTVLAETAGEAYEAAAEAYWTAEGAFWTALEAYNGVWDDGGNCTVVGAYDAYVAAAESGADNTDALYAAAQTARTNCTNSYQTLQTKYNEAMTAYGALADADKTTDFENDKSEIERCYAEAGICANELAELFEPSVYASRADFFAAMESYDAAVENYWNLISNYYGADENTPGSYGNYIDALNSGAQNVKELYAAASADRAACVEAFAGLTPLYQASAAAYDAMDATAQSDEGVQETKTNLESSYADAVQTNNELETLAAPEDYVPDMGELSTIWIDANGNLNGNPYAPMYWRVNAAGKIVAATADDWSLKIEKTAQGTPVMTLRDFVFTSVPAEADSAIWSDTSLILELWGTNSITGTKGSALGVTGNLETRGTGSLTLNAVLEETTDDSGENYGPMALFVGGTWTNSVNVTADSKNARNTIYAKNIINTGTVTVGAGQVIREDTAVHEKLAPPGQESSSYDSGAAAGNQTTQTGQGTSSYDSGAVAGNQTTQTVSPMTGEKSQTGAAIGALCAAGIATAYMTLRFKRRHAA